MIMMITIIMIILMIMLMMIIIIMIILSAGEPRCPNTATTTTTTTNNNGNEYCINATTNAINDIISSFKLLCFQAGLTMPQRHVHRHVAARARPVCAHVWMYTCK